MVGTDNMSLTIAALGTVVVHYPPFEHRQAPHPLHGLGRAHEVFRLRELANRQTAELVPAIFHETFGGSAAATFPLWQRLADISDIASRRRQGTTPERIGGCCS